MSSSVRTRSDSKVAELCRFLRELAIQNGPGAKLPTARDLCKMFGTTPATLNDALGILEEQNVITRRQGIGIFVSPRINRRCICVLLYSYLFMADHASPFWGMLWGLFAREAQRRLVSKDESYSFHMILQSPENELALSEELITMIVSQKVHGVLAVGLLSPTNTWIAEHGVPCVTFAGRGDIIVSTDTVELVNLALGRLAEQGCKRIGIWSATVIYKDQDIMFAPQFIDMALYCQAILGGYGLPFDPQLMKNWSIPTDPNARLLNYQEQGYQLAMDVFGDPSSVKPDGIFLMDDMLTTGVMAAFQKLGVKVGKDVQIVTHSNTGSPTLFGLTDSMTLVEIDPGEIVEKMFTMLDLLMEGAIQGPRIVHVKPKLYLP